MHKEFNIENLRRNVKEYSEKGVMEFINGIEEWIWKASLEGKNYKEVELKYENAEDVNTLKEELIFYFTEKGLEVNSYENSDSLIIIFKW